MTRLDKKKTNVGSLNVAENENEMHLILFCAISFQTNIGFWMQNINRRN